MLGFFNTCILLFTVVSTELSANYLRAFFEIQLVRGGPVVSERLRPFWPDLPSGLAEDEMIREIRNLFETRLSEFSPSSSYHHHSVSLSLPCFLLSSKMSEIKKAKTPKDFASQSNVVVAVRYH